MRRFLPALIGLFALLGVPAALAQSAGWPQLQGGPEHAGVAPGAAEPPYRVAWEAPAGASGHLGAAGPVVAGDLVYAVGREEVVALEAASGDVAWTVARSPAAPVTPALTGDGALLVYPEGAGDTRALVGLDVQTHAVRWRYVPTDEVRSAPATDGDAVYAATRGGTVVALDAATGTERWTFDATGPVRSPLAVAGGAVYAVAVDTETFEITLHAIDAEDGTDMWRFRPPAPGVYSSGATVADGRVYVAFGDGVVRALDPANGGLLWESTVGLREVAGLSTTPALLDDDLVVAMRGGSLARLDGGTGLLEWRHRFPSVFLHGSPLVVGRHVLAGRADGVLVSVDAATGRLTSRVDLGAGSVTSLAPAGTRLVAGLMDTGGGIVALEHDSEASLTSIESPSVLRWGSALANFAVAAAAVTAGIAAGFRVLGRRLGIRKTPAGGDAAEEPPPPGSYR